MTGPNSNRELLDWNIRMKIAAGVAKALAYMHKDANPRMIHRDVKSANVLLDKEYNPKLSDFGLAILSPGRDTTCVTTTPMGTVGWCDPKYENQDQLTTKADIYSFGVLILELITGRKAYDSRKSSRDDRYLAKWV